MRNMFGMLDPSSMHHVNNDSTSLAQYHLSFAPVKFTRIIKLFCPNSSPFQILNFERSRPEGNTESLQQLS